MEVNVECRGKGKCGGIREIRGKGDSAETSLRKKLWDKGGVFMSSGHRK